MRALPGSGGILSAFVRHRTLANLLMVILVVAGIAAGTRIRSQFFPDVVVGNVTVSVAWSGAGADDVDRAIVQAVEPVLLAVEGVASSSARSREGSATITLEFDPGWDMSRAAEDVQTAVDAIRTLPDDADDPVVRRGAWRDRVTDVVITGPVSVDQLGRFADELVGRLFGVGITRTTIQGLAAPETVVEVSSVDLIRHDIGLRDIAAAIGIETRASPAGDVSGGSARVRTGVERRTAEEIAGIVLRRGADGATLTVGDVASVRTLGADRVQASFVGDNPAIVIRVDRTDSGDAIGMQAAVAEAVAALQTTLPQGVTAGLIRSRAEEISDRLSLLIDNGLMGLGLVILLLFLFLNARTAFWVAAGIPVAMAGAIAAMYMGGLTINMMSLFALIITLGIVVDDAIVVGEHADFRARELGEVPVVAAENAARRMAAPVFASTLTTVFAFMAMFAVSGQFGSLVSAIPFTVIAVLLASLVECFLILPHHMSHALAAAGRERWYDWPSRTVNRGFGWVRDRLFRPLMWGMVRARYAVLALAVLALASQAALLVRGDVPWRFFNSPEQGSITGNFSMLPGASRDDTVAMMREVQRATRVVGERYAEEHGTNPLAYVMAQIGGNAGRTLPGAETKEAEQLGAISIELIDPDLRPYSSFEFLGALQAEVQSHPKLEELSFRGWRSGPGGDALSVQLSGADADALKAAAEAVKTALAPFPQVSALEDTLAYDKEELILTLTPQGEALGFTIDALGRSLRERLNGIEAASYPDNLRSATIRVEVPAAERTGDFLDRTLLRTAAGQYVPLADIVTVAVKSGFSTVRRENGLRVVTVTGDLAEDDAQAAAEVQRRLAAEILPTVAEEYGVIWRLTGLKEQENQFLSDALLGLMLCLISIYLVLSWIFASWTRPIVVMSVIPFGLVGAVWGHQVWGVPFSMFSVIGMLGMTGIIINDSIVLVSAIDEKAEARGLWPAIVDGAADRLRPVLLTTLTTVLGLAPLLYEASSQAQFLKPTVITLAYGLGFGMVLVLTVVPALMAMQSDVARFSGALRRALTGGRRTGVAGRIVTAATVMAGLSFVALVVPVAVTGTLATPVAALFPALGAAPALPVALALFLAVVVAVSAVAYALGAVVMRRGAARG